MHINTIRRLEAVEAAAVLALVDALAGTGCTDPVPSAVPLASGFLVITGARRYINRALGVTLDELSSDDVDTIVRHYTDADLPAAVQMSSWAPATTVSTLSAAGFAPAWCRSMLVADLRDPITPSLSASPAPSAGHGLEIVEVGADAARAAQAAEVMVDEARGTGADRTTSDEFMTADFHALGTTQFLALVDGQPVGCGSLCVVDVDGARTGWLGAAATIPSARGRGVQTALVRHRLRLAADAGCDLAGATASVGSTSSRVLRRCGLALVQEQWVVQRA